MRALEVEFRERLGRAIDRSLSVGDFRKWFISNIDDLESMDGDPRLLDAIYRIENLSYLYEGGYLDADSLVNELKAIPSMIAGAEIVSPQFRYVAASPVAFDVRIESSFHWAHQLPKRVYRSSDRSPESISLLIPATT